MKNIIVAAGLICVFAGVVCAGTISGRVVRDSDGAGIGSVTVYAYDYNTGNYVMDASTDSDGYYSITGLYGGTYRVGADTWGMPYSSEYYDDVYGWSNATGVAVTEGQDTSGIDFGLAVEGTITGRVVRDSDGAGIGSVTVYVYDYNTGNSVMGVSTDSDGYYSITGLYGGTYRVRADTWGTPYISEYYNDTQNLAEATGVAVTEGQDTSGIDFGLAEMGAVGGTISGRVTSDSGGAGVRGMLVIAWDYESWDFCGEAQTDAGGYYSITGLYGGTYRVQADTWGTPYISEYYDDVYGWSNATGVAVTEGQDTSGIDFGLAAAGTITGRVVRDSDGAGIGSVTVYVHDYNTGTPVSGASTDSDGYYSITGLHGGTYGVRADTRGTPYTSEYYDDVYGWSNATGVSVTQGEETGGIDFGLAAVGDGYEPDDTFDAAKVIATDGSVQLHDFHHGGDLDWVKFTLTGAAAVTIETGGDDSDGDTVMWLYDGDGTTELTYDDDGGEGWYSQIVTELGPGTYYVAAAPYGQDDLIQYTLSIRVVEVYGISGTVRDLHTGMPVEDMRVGCWHDAEGLWRDTWTDEFGYYSISGLPAGEVDVQVLPDSGSPYARVGRTVGLTSDMSRVDFALPLGATLSGRVVDAETAEPIGDIYVDYSSERYDVWQNADSDTDGYFTLTNLPPGMADLDVEAWDDPSYIWLSWPANLIYLEEGQDASGRVMAMRHGVRVWGYVKDADGQPVSSVPLNFDGAAYKGETETDGEGYYDLYLPDGNYAAGVDFDEDDAAEDQWVSSPVGMTVSGLDDIWMPDIVAYSRATGEQISGSVVNAGGWGEKTPFVVALLAGTPLAPETFALVATVCEATPSDTGEFVIPILPPGNYDVYLGAEYGDADDVGSIVICDKALNVAAGTSDVILNAALQQGTLRGIVRNADGEPVMGTTVFIADSASGEFAGMAESGPGGRYTAQNMPAGTYTLTAMHPKYETQAKTVTVTDGLTTWVNTFEMPFAGGKEASDLNGDAVTDVGDLVLLAGQWLAEGEADLDESGAVNLVDLARTADLWRTEALWTLTGDPRDMIGRWPMDENEASKNVFDHSGNGHHGAAHSNTAALSADGKVGGCFNFSGSHHVRVADHEDFTFGDGVSDSPFSISAWVYYNGGSGTQTVISKDGLLAGSREWNLLFVSNQLYMYLLGANGSYIGKKTNSAVPAGWRFIAMTYDGAGLDGIRIFIDGQEAGCSSITRGSYVAMNNTATDMLIGAFLNGSTPIYPFGDRMDEVIIYDRTLSTDEIATLYGNGGILTP